MIIVSKATKRHCAGTVQSQEGRVGNVKQVVFEPRPEDSYRRYRSDKIKQTVPDASSGDRKSSVTDGRQSGAADNQWRSWTGTKSLTSLDICHMTKLVGKVCRCRRIMIMVLMSWSLRGSCSECSTRWLPTLRDQASSFGQSPHVGCWLCLSKVCSGVGYQSVNQSGFA